MIIQEPVNKQGTGVAKRMNELGLGLADVVFLDWNPGIVQMLYEVEEEGVPKMTQSERMRAYWAKKKAETAAE